jgi:uncharacterized protein (DUF1778 family)
MARRDCYIRCRVTGEEKMILENYAKHSNLSLSDFIRHGCQLAVTEIDDKLDFQENFERYCKGVNK